MDISYLEKKSKNIRRAVLEMVYKAKSPHVGTSFSCTDILVALYFAILKINPKNPQDDARDRFILSKGHGVSALYAVLAEIGFFPKEELSSYCQNGSRLICHATIGSVPGIDASSGSGGHGFPMGNGMAISLRKKNIDAKVYVLVGDGECEEGSIWEGVMFAAQHKLNNLTLIIDKNNLQIMGNTADIIDIRSYEEKFKSFHWDAISIDGHNIQQILDACNKNSGDLPKVIIANTIKGKGVSFMENKAEWHSKFPNDEQYQLALKELA